MENLNYKVTYNSELMCCQFERVSDGAILYANEDERLVVLFAKFNDYNFFIE